LDWGDVQECDVFDIDENLVDWDFVLAAHFQLALHTSDQYFVNTTVLLMELMFFVVHSVEKIFDVRDFGFRRGEISEKAFIEHFYACEFLIQRFDLLKYESFFNFLVIEHSFEDVFVSQFQKISKAVDLFDFADMFILLEVIEQFSIKEDFAIDMLWHFRIVILDKIDYLS